MSAKLKLVKNPMTASEARDALTKFCAMIGPKAYVSVHMGSFDTYHTKKVHPKPLSASLYARGMYPEKMTLGVECDTFDEVVAEIERRWIEHSRQHTVDLIKAMALEVIRITDDRGACTDADLRAEKFSHNEVARYGEAACAKASEMASKGPFSIITTSGSNFVGAAE